MRKNFGKKTWMYPLPVLLVGSYGENGTPDIMNAAWGGIYDTNKVMLCLSSEHKTSKNIKSRGAFTLSFASAEYVCAADYVGIVSANNVPNKVERAGLHTFKSEFVDAPVIEEFPFTLECTLEKINEDGIFIGNIVNISADESVLDKDGAIDVSKLRIITFDPVGNSYIELGKKVGTAFKDGNTLK